MRDPQRLSSVGVVAGIEMEDCKSHPGGVRVYAQVGDDEATGRDIEWVLLGPGGTVEASGRLEWNPKDKFYVSVVGDFTLVVGHYRVIVTSNGAAAIAARAGDGMSRS